MRQLIARIISNQEIVPLHYRMALHAPAIAKEIRPGQFIHVRCSDGSGPFLRRPFSLHRKTGERIEILYKVLGPGTMFLSRKGTGDTLDIIGPLGNGFAIGRVTSDERRATILVAGGMGVAPLVALAEELAKDKRTKLRVLIGACAKEHILCEKEFKRLGAEVLVSTEDGSKGRKGLVTEILKSFLRVTSNEQRATIYACGPNAMLKAVAGIAVKKRIPCQISLEERMACGIGVCLGCPVKVSQLASWPVGQFKPANRQTGKPANYVYKMVCKDGPVFNAEEVLWE